MVFPFCGRSAHRILRDWPGGGGLPPVRIKQLAWQVLQALSYLHSRKVRGRVWSTVVVAQRKGNMARP